MKIGRFKRFVHRGMAWVLIATCFVSYAEKLDGGVIDVQAKEEMVTENSEDIEEGNCILSMGNNHSAVIKSDGSLWMWGSNQYGQLGIGDENIRSSNKPIQIMDNVKSISVGGSFGCSAAITNDNSLWMWGDVVLPIPNQHAYEGWLWEPEKIMDNVKSVALGGSHAAIIKTDGSLWMWGKNDYGQLGDGTKDNSFKPIKLMDDVQKVSTGKFHCAAIKADGSLWMWGRNDVGQLGIGNSGDDVCVPTLVMNGVKEVSLGGFHSAAIKADDSLWIWGSNDYWVLGLGEDYRDDAFEPIKLMDKVSIVSLGEGHSAVIKSDGSLWTWGCNFDEQLGNGSTYEEQYSVAVPTQIMSSGSISVSSSSGSNFEMTTQVQDKPRIRVLDAKKCPLQAQK